MVKKSASKKRERPSKATSTSSKKAKLEQPEKEDESSDESSEDGEVSLFPNDEGQDEDEGDKRIMEVELDIEADIDEMSEFAETDEEDEDMQANQKWADYYMSADRNRNVREHFLSTFYGYLKHFEGGGHAEAQSLLHVRQIHIILDALDKKGKDLTCLVVNDCLDIWGSFAGPRLKNKVLTGNTIKVYLRSLEYFATFIKMGFFYKKGLLPPPPPSKGGNRWLGRSPSQIPVYHPQEDCHPNNNQKGGRILQENNTHGYQEACRF